jgi:CRP/FNR family cyclic AMP-dependent transcriptional regulator
VKLPNIFERGTTPVTVRAGETIFSEGEPAELMYVIKHGQVEILRDGQLLETVGPDDFFGEMALVDSSPRSATARAKTDCELMPINEKHFMFMVGETPFFSLIVLRKVVERLRNKNP